MKKKLFAILVAATIFTGCGSTTVETVYPDDYFELKNERDELKIKVESYEKLLSETETTSVEQTSTDNSDISFGMKNAVSTAKNYISSTGFSRSGLIHQLEFEGYSTEEAEYGADNCDADYNELCVVTANNYLDSTSFSEEGLRHQLDFEGYTAEQIDYAIEKVYK